jgi:hypothetical protein
LQQDEWHRQVFETEQAFLEQSKLFQEGLSDATAAKQAQAKRRGARYQQDQECQKLEQALDEWQHVLDERQQEQRQRRQQQRSSFETETTTTNITENTCDDKRKEETPQEDDDESSWLLVDDQSTGDQFYWNSETGEMKCQNSDSVVVIALYNVYSFVLTTCHVRT